MTSKQNSPISHLDFCLLKEIKIIKYTFVSGLLNTLEIHCTTSKCSIGDNASESINHVSIKTPSMRKNFPAFFLTRKFLSGQEKKLVYSILQEVIWLIYLHLYYPQKYLKTLPPINLYHFLSLSSPWPKSFSPSPFLPWPCPQPCPSKLMTNPVQVLIPIDWFCLRVPSMQPSFTLWHFRTFSVPAYGFDYRINSDEHYESQRSV